MFNYHISFLNKTIYFKRNNNSMKSKILFITNKRNLPSQNETYSNTLSSGLLNSITFVIDMLIKEGYVSKCVQVDDGNRIDKEIVENKPSHVIIEALWVSPSKLNELCILHPNVKWIIRIHSEIPFLANEGIAIEWLFEYIKISDKISISTNSNRISMELADVLNVPVFYLPNYYNIDLSPINKNKKVDSNVINIACFGAIRPLKNQLIQAISAIKFTKDINKKLYFHINVNREETGGNSVLKNIRSLFKNNENTLVEHPWTNHEKFIEIVKGIDIGMQVSFSETYNIVAADFVNCDVPIVVSDEINFIDENCKANTTSVKDIVEKLHFIYSKKKLNKLIERNKELLEGNNKQAIKEWKKLF